MHDGIGTAITVATVLGTSYFGFAAINSLRADTNQRLDILDRRFEQLQRDMREFYGELRSHDARLSNLEQPRAR